MTSIMEIMQLCRLCLVKEQVNVPIFEEHGDLEQIIQKISVCLPVKVSKEDKLPKKICDGCSYKLELLYQFRNTSVNAEKQLLSWINQLGGQTAVDEPTKPQATTQHTVKQEVDVSDTLDHPDTDYLLEQQLTYTGSDTTFAESQDDNGAGDDDDASNSSDDEPLSKRRKRLLESQGQVDRENTHQQVTQHLAVTKTEDASESEGEEKVDDPEPNFVSVGIGDAQQPGPSGLGKAVTDIPFDQSGGDNTTRYECELCIQVFPTKSHFVNHYMKEDTCGLVCCTCDAVFTCSADLFQHQQSHRIEKIIVEPAEIQFEEYSENVQAVLNIPNDDVIVDPATNDLLYILDDSPCINEVVIEESNHEIHKINKNLDNSSVVQVDHGYMMSPRVAFNNDLESKQKRSYISTKARQSPPKRRHEVPDFSASNYVVLTPNADVDIVHYKCLRCEQLFISKFVFLRHIEKGKCYVNNCDVCPAVFDRNSEFYDHYIAEHTDRAICNFCFRTFMYEKNVKEHMLRHLDQFRHRCDVCSKGFYTLREYRNHYKNRHMGIRHRCEDCGRSFADEYYFKRHIATHTKKLLSGNALDS